MRLGRPWGGAGGTPPAPGTRHRVMHPFLGVPRSFDLPMHLEARTDALAAGGLAKIGDRGGNLEGAVQLHEGKAIKGMSVGPTAG